MNIDNVENVSDDEIVMVLETRDDVLANMVKEALESERIPVLLKSPTGYYLRGMLPIDQGFFNLRLYVQKSFRQRAAEIIKIIVPSKE